MNASTLTETIQWNDASKALPDGHTTCFIATEKAGSDEIDIGYFDGEYWFVNDQAAEATYPEVIPEGVMIAEPVYAWAYAPVKPPRDLFASRNVDAEL